MHVDQPSKISGEWVVKVRKARTPLAPIVESINCGSSRESAWQDYIRIKKEVAAMPREMIDIPATKSFATDGAVLLDVGKDNPVWFPLKVATDNGDGTWQVPEDMAYEKGVI